MTQIQITPDEMRLIQEHRAKQALETKTTNVPITLQALNAVAIAQLKDLLLELLQNWPSGASISVDVVAGRINRRLRALGDAGQEAI